MKNLYKKGKVHPSPSPSPPPPPSTVHQYFSLLPPAILTLAAALSPQEAEVLAYLISCCGTTSTPSFSGRARTTHNGGDSRGGDDGGGGVGDHSPKFGCNCFRCYMSFWARWDGSPNRQVIHEIIEAYEEGLLQKKMRKSMKKKKEKGRIKACDESKEMGSRDDNQQGSGTNELESAEPPSGCGQHEGGVADVETEKGTVRKIASFIGDKIWGVWNRD